MALLKAKAWGFTNLPKEFEKIAKPAKKWRLSENANFQLRTDYTALNQNKGNKILANLYLQKLNNLLFRRRRQNFDRFTDPEVFAALAFVLILAPPLFLTL